MEVQDQGASPSMVGFLVRTLFQTVPSHDLLCGVQEEREREREREREGERERSLDSSFSYKDTDPIMRALPS